MCLTILLCLHYFWCIAAEEDNFIFLNTGSPVDLRWFQGGTQAKDDGMLIQRMETGQGSISTHFGHTFRFYDGARKSPFFSHQGGGLNIVGIAGLEVEVLGPKEFTSFVWKIRSDCIDSTSRTACIRDIAKCPRLGIALPQAIIEKVMLDYAPDRYAPQILIGGFGISRDAYGETAPDELVFLNASPRRYALHWFFGNGDKIVESESKQLGVVDKAEPGTSSILRVKARPDQKFYVAFESWQSNLFLYPGDFGMVVVSEWEVESIDEDSLKVLIGKVARECSKALDENSNWNSCLEERVVLPRTGVRLPAVLSNMLFKQLWSSFEHWQLCENQNATTPLRSESIVADDGTYKVDVLRESPLVLAVHGVLAESECHAISSQAPVEELSMAFVNGGGHSRNRRTLSKNMYADSDLTNPLTRATRRFFDIARRSSGFELYMEGQEPINWLYYKPGYEYRPHCDGNCGSSSIAFGQRVATSLVYCTIAQEGGHTVFPNDALKVTPLPGMMLFFTYNPDPSKLSFHSACPVTKGVKTTATQWYREGVSNDVNWEAVNKGVRPTRRAEM